MVPSGGKQCNSLHFNLITLTDFCFDFFGCVYFLLISYVSSSYSSVSSECVFMLPFVPCVCPSSSPPLRNATTPGKASIVNCTFINNYGGFSGSVIAERHVVSVVNTTFWKNLAFSRGMRRSCFPLTFTATTNNHSTLNGNKKLLLQNFG